MDEQDKLEFDTRRAELLRLRNQSDLEQRADALVAEFAPLIAYGIGEGVDVASVFAGPAAPFLSLGGHMLQRLLEGALQRFALKAAPAIPPFPGPGA